MSRSGTIRKVADEGGIYLLAWSETKPAELSPAERANPWARPQVELAEEDLQRLEKNLARLKTKKISDRQGQQK